MTQNTSRQSSASSSSGRADVYKAPPKLFITISLIFWAIVAIVILIASSFQPLPGPPHVLMCIAMFAGIAGWVFTAFRVFAAASRHSGTLLAVLPLLLAFASLGFCAWIVRGVLEGVQPDEKLWADVFVGCLLLARFAYRQRVPSKQLFWDGHPI